MDFLKKNFFFGIHRRNELIWKINVNNLFYLKICIYLWVYTHADVHG